MRRPVCLIGLAFVVLIRFYLYLHPFPLPDLEQADKSVVTFTGQVDKKEYRISDQQKILVIYLKDVQDLNPQITGVICYMEGKEEPHTGSYVRMQGKLRTFAQATNPGEFDAAHYYQILGIQARIQDAVVLQETSSYDRFREGLYQIRCYFSFLIDCCYEEKDASIMKAILLGEKSGLDTEIKELYQLNGVIHILSISGLHISLIGMGLYKILHRCRCPMILNVLISIAFMYCYGVMTGMSISALRAIMMFAFHIAAGLFRRTYDMLTAMAVAAITVLVRQPLYLYHSGFLFSFGAILAIGLFLPVLEENLFWKTKLEKVMSTSLAVSIITLPVYLCFYYEYPLYSLLLNLLIIPGTTVIVSGGLAVLAAASCYLPLGKYATYPVHLLLAFYESCCMWTLKLPGSRNILGRPKNWQIVVFALLLSAAVFGSRKWSRLQFWMCILSAVLFLTLRLPDGLQITILDVGQGDCIYIADESGGRCLIDGGSSSKSDVGTYQILPFLKEEGVGRLDAVFVTHMDADHYNGIRMLIEEMNANGIAISNLFLPDIGESAKSEEYRELARLAAGQGVAVQYIHKGDVIRHGELTLTCLHPQKGSIQETNAASIVLYLEYETFTALFTGDLEGSGEEELRRELEDRLAAAGDVSGFGADITVLKVAHHGSKNSTGEAFLKTASPKIALISAGKDNRYGHPHEELLKRLSDAGCHVYVTAKGGALTITYRNGKVRVETFVGE
ncbi:MAG: DNA internalization-related competence protein ComEC/Rec2 [Ruminococcus sp.]|nr:DNA internalization-related competence protein ComEC/Rec2 [Ruminococcus sp.]